MTWDVVCRHWQVEGHQAAQGQARRSMGSMPSLPLRAGDPEQISGLPSGVAADQERSQGEQEWLDSYSDSPCLYAYYLPALWSTPL